MEFEFEFTLKSIQEHRKDQNISQLELCRRTYGRVPQSLISELESGTRKLTGYTSIPLADALKTNVLGLCIGQEMHNKGITFKDREKLLKDISEGNADLLRAYKSVNRVKDLDFKDRDSWGRKLDKEQVEARDDTDLSIERDSFGRKRTKKEIKALRKKVKKSREKIDDFGDRDAFGIKRKVVKKRYDELDDSDDMKLADLMEGTEDEKFLAKLNILLEKGEERRRT
ncbi:hypothetical protein ES702_07095 [subsurface metagenome]